MFEIKGKYNTAKIFTNVVDENAIAQAIELLNQRYVKDSKIRFMPDIHAGAGCTIGTTMTITDAICPNLVGVDIGCGMFVIKLNASFVDLEQLDKIIHEFVPAGCAIQKDKHPLATQVEETLKDLKCFKFINYGRALLSIGTLGGGNHFIELAKNSEDELYLIIHSGSRHLGLEIAKYYQDMAKEVADWWIKANRQATIEYLKWQGRENEIQETLKTLPSTSSTSKDLAYVDGELFDDYIHDMKIAQAYADINRKAIAETILTKMGITSCEAFTTIHNYIDTDNMILRKGAVSAQLDEKLIIPINMRDGSLICRGKGNPDWNYSAPHGAGRLFSRSAAKENFTVEEFKESMSGIYTTSVNQSTLDECPMAYKSIEDIVNNINDTVDIIDIIKPIYNFKAGN